MLKTKHVGILNIDGICLCRKKDVEDKAKKDLANGEKTSWNQLEAQKKISNKKKVEGYDMD
jgi:hypothetical protein